MYCLCNQSSYWHLRKFTVFVQLNDLQSAVPCAYTFLQKNPKDQEMHQIMEAYKSEYDLSGYLTDYEERPYEVKAAQIGSNCLSQTS